MHILQREYKLTKAWTATRQTRLPRMQICLPNLYLIHGIPSPTSIRPSPASSLLELRTTTKTPRTCLISEKNWYDRFTSEFTIYRLKTHQIIWRAWSCLCGSRGRKLRRRRSGSSWRRPTSKRSLR